MATYFSTFASSLILNTFMLTSFDCFVTEVSARHLLEMPLPKVPEELPKPELPSLSNPELPPLLKVELPPLEKPKVPDQNLSSQNYLNCLNLTHPKYQNCLMCLNLNSLSCRN
ncbi:hypothetical protein SDJN03_17316, partial [Cucurbita argyrosperma subsp. sororia]